MELVREKSGGSFYESFSDLVFGTLVLFIVVVMAITVSGQQKWLLAADVVIARALGERQGDALGCASRLNV